MRRDFQGPLAGLETAIPSIETDFLIMAACDTPLLPDHLAQRLMAAINCGEEAHNTDICYAHDGERGQYLCAILRRRALLSLPRYLDQGHRRFRDWFQQQRCKPVDFSGERECFRNFNHLKQGSSE